MIKIWHPLGWLLLGTIALQGAELNKPAPQFSLPDLRQQKRALSDYRGKVVLINFWASWCAPCQMELPELHRLARDYRKKNVRIVAINVDQDRQEAKKMISKLGLASPALDILLDSKSKAVSAYNAEAMPSSYILDQKGNIRFIHVGYHEKDPAAWRKEIDSLLQQ